MFYIFGFLHENSGKTSATTKPTYAAAFRLKACGLSGLSSEKLTLSFTLGTSLFRSADSDRSGLTVHIHFDLAPHEGVRSKWIQTGLSADRPLGTENIQAR